MKKRPVGGGKGRSAVQRMVTIITTIVFACALILLAAYQMWQQYYQNTVIDAITHTAKEVAVASYDESARVYDDQTMALNWTDFKTRFVEAFNQDHHLEFRSDLTPSDYSFSYIADPTAKGTAIGRAEPDTVFVRAIRVRITDDPEGRPARTYQATYIRNTGKDR